jgi:hypothetical protein
MRRAIFISVFIASLSMLSAPIDLLNTSVLWAAQVEQTKAASSTGALAFLSRTIWEIPEPATLVLLGTGLAAASRFIQRKRRNP